MRQLVKELAAKLDDPSSTPRTHMMEGESWVLHVVLWHVLDDAHTCI